MSANTCSCNLLTWKDPVKTGKVFASAVVSLVVIKYVNLINLFFRLSAVILLASAAAEYAGKLVTGTGFVTKYKPAVKSYAKEFNSNLLPQLAKSLECLEAEFYSVLYSANVECTLRTAGASYILYKITSWFSLYTLAVTAVVVAFTAPAIYVNFKKEIDAAVAEATKVAKAKTDEYTTLAKEKAGPVLKDLEKKLGPVGSFISSKLPVRTASSTVGETAPVKVAEVPSTATTTSSSQFPSVPETISKKIDVVDLEPTEEFQNVEDALHAKADAVLN